MSGQLLCGMIMTLSASNAAAAGQTEPQSALPCPALRNCELAFDYSVRNGGFNVLVMVEGKIVFERYANGAEPEKACHIHSATKAFWGIAVAAMIEDGLVSSFDEPVTNAITEWQDLPRKRSTTVRHLLTLTGGLVQDVRALQGFGGTAGDKYQHSLGVRSIAEPGTRFAYGPSNYYVLGEFMKRKLANRRQTPLDYLKQRILDPIGCRVDHWKHDPSGNPHIPNGAFLQAREWIKFGQFLLNKGAWEGKRIVREELLEECLRPGMVNAGHGLAIWLNQPGGHGPFAAHTAPPAAKAGWIYPEGRPDMFAAMGAGKNRMYIIPSLDMVVVRQCEKERRDGFQDHVFIHLLLTGAEPSVKAGSAEPDGPRRVLLRMDRNQNGTIERNEAGPQLEKVFDRFDRNGDDVLDPQELRILFDRLARTGAIRPRPGNGRSR